jgi:hypothetical protein
MVKKYKSGRHFEMFKGRNLIFRTKVGTISLYLQLEFEVGTSSGFKVIRNYVKNLYRPTDRKPSILGPMFIGTFFFIFARGIIPRSL